MSAGSDARIRCRRRYTSKVWLPLCLWVAACGSSQAAALTKADYAAHKRQIEADFKADRSACDRWTENDRDVCIVKAKGREKVAKSELDYNNTGTANDANRLSVARADADLAVARELCDSRRGKDKALCTANADAAHAKALQDIARGPRGKW